jgi:hypothetical protein
MNVLFPDPVIPITAMITSFSLVDFISLDHDHVLGETYLRGVPSTTIFSTRTLHYTQDEIVFECRTGYLCECGSIWSGIEPAVSNCLKLAYAQILEESRKFGDGHRYIGSALTSPCNKGTLLLASVSRGVGGLTCIV